MISNFNKLSVFFIACFKTSPLQPFAYGHNINNLFMQIKDLSGIVVYRWVKTQKTEYDIAATWDKDSLSWSLSEVTGEIGMDRISDEELEQMKGIYERTRKG